MKLRRVTAWGLVLATVLSLDVSSVNATVGTADKSFAPVQISNEDREQQKKTAMEEGKLPGTVRTFFDSDDTIRDYFNVSGYVSEGVQDRSEYYEEYVKNGKKNTENYVVVEEDGYWKKGTTDYITTEAYDALDESVQAEYEAVTAEKQFTWALEQEPKVIQVNAEELELGFHYLDSINAASSAITPVTDYGKATNGEYNVPITNPVIMNAGDPSWPKAIASVFKNEFDGTGLSDLSLYSHMTIFSTTGCIIRHAGIDVGGCEDVVIRNFQFEGMYEWDENKNYATDSRKRYGWCNVSLNSSKDIWVDHCTFGFAFDGNLDIKNGSSATVTWCKFGVQDLNTAGEEKLEPAQLPKWYESKGCELWKNILYMEECYQEYVKAREADENAPNAYPYYAQYRDSGVSLYEVFRYAALHSKVHLCGSGEGDFYTNVQEKITLGFNYYTNVMQRMPMIRSGNGHMYNCIVDNAEYQANAKEVAKKVEAAGYTRGYTTYISVNNPRNGATIGTDTCIFNEVTPCRNYREVQDDLKAPWNSILGKAVNHHLVVNSKVTFGGKTYTGSSWDNNGTNLFTSDDCVWNDGKKSIGDFEWAKWDGLDQFLNEGDYNADKTVTNIENWVNSKGGYAFYKKFYVGQKKLEYAYKCFKLDEVEEKLAEYGGARRDLYGADGTPADYIQPHNMKNVTKKVTINTDGAAISGAAGNTAYLKAGESVALPTADDMEKTGYIFRGWKKGTDGELLAPNANGEVLVAAGDAYAEEAYYAVWEEIQKYTISFNSMGGSEVTSITVETGQTIKDVGGFPEEPTKEGFTFLGWYSYNLEDETYGDAVDENASFAENTILYAKWEEVIVGTLGNVNGDVDEETGEAIIDTKDALAVLKYSMKLDPGESFDVSLANVNGDVNEETGEAIIDTKDALEILKYSMRLIDKFSAEEVQES